MQPAPKQVKAAGAEEKGCWPVPEPQEYHCWGQDGAGVGVMRWEGQGLWDGPWGAEWRGQFSRQESHSSGLLTHLQFLLLLLLFCFLFVVFFEQRLLPQDSGKSRISLQRTHHVLACWKRYVTGVEVEVEVSKARAITS